MTEKVLAVEAAPVRGAADVDALGAREEEDLPARLPEPVAPVRLLAEEEERLVERPHLVDRVPPHEHARTHDELGLAHLVVVEAARVERVERPRPRRELAQEEVLGRQPPQGREPAHRPLQRPVRVQQARPDDRGARPPSANATSRASASPRSHASAFREEDVPALGLPDPQVPAGPEPAVLRLDDAHLREPLADEGDGAVARAVVDDDDLLAPDAREAVLDPGQRVVGDDDDRCVLSHARPAAASLRGLPPRA